MPKDILDGVYDIIDQTLGLEFIGKVGKKPHYKHRESCRKLSEFPPSNFNVEALIKKIYQKVEQNWNDRSYKKDPSEKNWSFPKHRRISSKNKSSEVMLERKIVKIPQWANQVPAASGLVNERLDKRRAVDLVRQCQDGSYELVELKVKSDTPLYAAMEILQYGVLYIFSRAKREVFRYTKEQNPLLWATAVHLKVLAPCEYYKGCKLDWFEDEINSGLKRYIAEPTFDFQMDFKFEAFPPSFSLKPFPQPDAIIVALSDLRPVYSS